MGIRIYEEKAELKGHRFKRLCIEGYDRISAVEETGEIAIFGGHPYASMFLTVNKVEPSDGLTITHDYDFYGETSKMFWNNVLKNKKRTKLDE